MGTKGRPYSRIKDLHIEVSLNQNVESPRTTGLEDVELMPGFPTFALSDMETATLFLGKRISLPLLIAPLTGGGKESLRINRNLAVAAEQAGIAMALGSQRPMLEKKVDPQSYLVREFAPTIPLLANLGLVHAKRGDAYLLQAIESVRADGIMLYVNPLHEILQEEGEDDFRDALSALEKIIKTFPYPVLLKEVGTGFPIPLVNWASERRIAGIDTAGLGGTNWARIEGLIQGKDYSMYEALGSCTRDTLMAVRGSIGKGRYLIASGGIRSGVDMAKAFALGADLCSMALPFLRWAAKSGEEVVRGIEKLREELKIAMWYAGARTVNELKGNFQTMSRSGLTAKNAP